MPDVIIGLMPSSINVPLFDARITRNQNKGSAYCFLTIP
jgi:hypothetical protein